MRVSRKSTSRKMDKIEQRYRKNSDFGIIVFLQDLLRPTGLV